MKSRWLAIVALAALAAALAVIVHFAPHSDVRATFPLSSLAAREVRLIRIEHSARPATVLKREGELWHITAPLNAPAEPFQVDRLLAILSARSPQRTAPTELARFELDPAPIQITFDAQTLSFGMVNSVTREQYVLTGGAVFVTEPRYAAAVPLDPMPLVRRRLFAEGAVPVRVELPEFSLARSDTGWIMAPAREGLSQDDFNRFAEHWALATATHVGQPTARPVLAAVRIAFKDGAKVELEVVQREPVLVLRHRGFQIEYTLPAASARALLTAPGAPR
ncbi:MAG: DUF4340 domain-containing protein [Betaproteobacteria bacterium]|nr:DUF4340 domain-containing protein [Betaproteobacteria bacterium]